MKVLAVNSSARTGIESKTELILDQLVAGLREGGAEVEVIELRKKKINYCIGCFTCWTKTPGVCVHKDDMTNELFPKFISADLVIMATPLYHFTVNAALKTFIERTLPILEPYIRKRGRASYHPLRHNHPKVAFVSAAGFPEYSVFDQLSSYVRFIYKENLLGEIFVAGAETLATALADPVRDEVFNGLKEAGRELAGGHKVSVETMAVIQQPVTDFEIMANLANCMWDTCIREGVIPRDMVKKGIVPRPQNVESFLAILPMGFNPAKAQDAECVIQFDFKGEVDGSCHFTIKDAAIVGAQGVPEKADLVIETPFDVWMDIMAGKADGAQMFMEGKYTAQGDPNILMKFGGWFGK